MVDTSRREMIKTIVKGGVYASPVIATMAAPARLMGQGPSGMMMPMWCDYFPILCMIFGDEAAAGMRSLTQPGQAPPGQPVGPPSPGSRPPPGNQPPGTIPHE